MKFVRDRAREAEMLRMRDAGSTYAAIGRAFALSAGRAAQLVERSKRERGDTDLPPTWREKQQMEREEEERREAALTPGQRQARDELRRYWNRRYDEIAMMNRPNMFAITGTPHPPCPLCDGTGLYDGEPCPDCTEPDDGQPTETEEWKDYDPDC